MKFQKRNVYGYKSMPFSVVIVVIVGVMVLHLALHIYHLLFLEDHLENLSLDG